MCTSGCIFKMLSSQTKFFNFAKSLGGGLSVFYSYEKSVNVNSRYRQNDELQQSLTVHDKLRIGTKDANVYLLKPQRPARTVCVWFYYPTIMLYFIGNARLQRKARQLDVFEEFEDFDIPGILRQYSLIALVTKSTGEIQSCMTNRFNVELRLSWNR